MNWGEWFDTWLPRWALAVPVGVVLGLLAVAVKAVVG